MRTLLPILLWVLLPLAAVGQEVSPQPQGPSGSLETLRELGAPSCQSERSRGQREAGTEGPTLDSSEAFSRSWSSAALGLTERENALPLYNATTLAVLRANRPEHFTEDEWLRMMREPVNRTLFPLRITPGMMDTLDMRTLDPGFFYRPADR